MIYNKKMAERTEVERQARELFSGLMPYTTHDLALSTAISFYKKAELTSELASQQLMARMTVLEWLNEGEVQPLLVESFENDLYTLYK